MSKRFTETKKWTVSFRKLPARLKCAWFFLWDFCDHAGIWQVDMEAMSLYVGETVTREEVIQAFSREIVEVGDGSVWFLPSFIVLQYAKPGKPFELNPKINAHRSALDLLAAVGIKQWHAFLEPAAAPPPPGAHQGVMQFEAPAATAETPLPNLRRFNQEQVEAKVGGLFKNFPRK